MDGAADGAAEATADGAVDRAADFPTSDRERYLDTWAALHGGYDPRASRAVSGWLLIFHALAAPLARRGVSPSTLTVLGPVVAWSAIGTVAAGGRWPLFAAVLVVASALVDGLDGAVAVMTGRVSTWGYVLDSLADRVADLAYVVALWFVGAPGPVCAGAGALVLLQEYARARAVAGGMSEIGVVTVAERPTRVLLTVCGLLAAGLVPHAAAPAATVSAAALAGFGLVGTVQLLAVVRRRLR